MLLVRLTVAFECELWEEVFEVVEWDFDFVLWCVLAETGRAESSRPKPTAVANLRMRLKLKPAPRLLISNVRRLGWSTLNDE